MQLKLKDMILVKNAKNNGVTKPTAASGPEPNPAT